MSVTKELRASLEPRVGVSEALLLRAENGTATERTLAAACRDFIAQAARDDAALPALLAVVEAAEDLERLRPNAVGSEAAWMAYKAAHETFLAALASLTRNDEVDRVR